MKILYVSCSVQPIHFSGVATWIVEMSEQLKKMGHELFVFTATFEQGKPFYETQNINHESYTGRVVNVHNGLQRYTDYYRADNYINYGLEQEFDTMLNEVQPDIVHFHALQGMGVNLIKKAKQLGYPTALSAHDWWFICPNMFMMDCYGEQCGQKEVNLTKCEECIKKIYSLDPKAQLPENWDTRQFLVRRTAYLNTIVNDYVDCFLPVSKTIQEYYQKNQFNAKQSMVLENGTDVTINNQKQTQKCNNASIVIGYVGGNVIAKGFWVLLEALAQLKETNWELHAYGYGCDEKDPDIREFLDNEKNQHIVDKIKLMKAYGPEQKPTIYQSFDLLIMPTISLESFSLVVREALLMQLPTIITACGGPEEVITHGENGWIVPPNDANVLSEQIASILQEPEQLDVIAQKIDASEIKSVTDQAKTLESLYSELMR